MPVREPGGQPLAQGGHGVGPGDAKRIEAETTGARLDRLA
jgi:hypothetical protein